MQSNSNGVSSKRQICQSLLRTRNAPFTLHISMCKLLLMVALSELVVAVTTEDYMTTDGVSELEPLNTDTTTDPNPSTSVATQPQNTTVDILQIIHERDSLKQEVDSLRIAVIILGIISGIAVIAVIIFVIWVLVMRRRSGKTNSCINIFHRSEDSPSIGTTTSTHTSTDSKTATQKRAKTTTDRDNVPRKQANEKGFKMKSLNPYTDNNDPSKAKRNEGYVGSDTSADSIFQPVGYNQNPKTSAASSDSDVYEITDDNGDHEHYEIVDHKPIPTTRSKTVPNSDANKNGEEKIYVNFRDIPQASGNYSGLDPTVEYTHFYN